MPPKVTTCLSSFSDMSRPQILLLQPLQWVILNGEPDVRQMCVGNVGVNDTCAAIALMCRETRGGRYSRPTVHPPPKTQNGTFFKKGSYVAARVRGEDLLVVVDSGSVIPHRFWCQITKGVV